MLTSSKNTTIQRIVKLQKRAKTRREENQFVIEGIRLVEEALKADLIPDVLLYTENLGPRGDSLIEAFQEKGVAATLVDTRVMKTASDTETPQGVLAVIPLPSPEMPASPTFILIPDGVRDPGNLGTIIRTAAAAGVDAILLPPGTADAFAPKTLRAGMGAHFQVPLLSLGWDEIQGAVANLQTWLADAAGQTLHTEANLAEPLALVIGGEASGVGPEITNLNPVKLRIPMPGGTESLNAAIAASILMYEVVRQRSA
jgi:TrmH family RNA methyltransferase